MTQKTTLTPSALPGRLYGSFAGKSESFPATSTAVWEFYFDFSKNNVFDAGDDISGYVQKANWQLGFSSAEERIARESTLELTLLNKDKRFSPENTGSPYYPNFGKGNSIQVQVTYNSTTYKMILTESGVIRPLPNTKGDRQTAVSSSGFLAKAQRAEVNVPLLENVTADTALRHILNYTEIYPPSFEQRWRLGKIGAAELGETTILGTLSDLLDTADEGSSILPIVGDNWHQTSMYAAMEELAGREYGRIFTDRSGKLVFHNRDRPLEKITPDETLNDSEIGSYEYAWGDNIINHSVATANPRTVGEAIDDVLGTIDKAVRIRGGETKEISIRFKTTSEGANIGGKNMIDPARGTDWLINELEDGSGVDWTNSIVWTEGGFKNRVDADLLEESATRAVVAWTNNGIDDVWLQVGAQIRGQKITSFSSVAVESVDSDSVKAYGRYKNSYAYPLDDIALAQGIADFTVRRLKNPTGTAKSITLKAHASGSLLTKCLANSIGNMIRITETQIGETADYFIIGEAWDWTISEWNCTYILEPALHAQADYWLLGVTGRSELGQTTYMGPF